MNNRVIHYADEGQVFAAESCGAHFELESFKPGILFQVSGSKFHDAKAKAL